MAHEDFHRPEEIKTSSNCSFGLVMAVAFAAVAFFPLLSSLDRSIRWWALCIGAVFLALAIVRPAVLAPLNRLWLRFGLLLHRVVSPVILFALYFLTIIPIGILMRAFGKDPLRFRFDRTAESYWLEREPPAPPPQSMKNQF